MLTLDIYSGSSIGYQKPAVERNGLHRLFAAAIVNNQFRETLLREPEAALASGYLGQPFALTDQERKIIQPVRAKTLTDCQWTQRLHTYGLLQGSFRPEDPYCVLRAYLRYRDELVSARSTQCQHIQKALQQMNLRS